MAEQDPQTNQQDHQTVTDDGVLDQHGQPGISRGKYERETKALNEEIAALKAQIAERDEGAKKGADRTAELEKSLADLKEQLATEKVEGALKAAGCVNTKAAKAVLADYDGDVAKMAEECPYLFKAKQTGTTGGKPGGAPDKAAEERRKARAAAGLKD